LGDPVSGGPGVGVALAEIVNSLPARAKLLAPDVGSVSIVAGDFVRDVEIGDGGVAKICGDAPTLALVVTGRLDLSGAQVSGELSVEPEAPDGLGNALDN
jgi:hypothetical protein